jgi:urease subunit alpha
MGDPNASIPMPQPVHYRPMFGSFGGGIKTSLTFVSHSALEDPEVQSLGLKKTVGSLVRDTRAIKKSDMIHNDWQPNISVDPKLIKF